jgi:hypothetical protein
MRCFGFHMQPFPFGRDYRLTPRNRNQNLLTTRPGLC